MKDGGWIPLDKRLIKYMPKDRPYTVIEAYFSLRYDVAENKSYTINGYAQLWQWDRKKVRTFVNGMMSGRPQKLGHLKDSKGAGKGTLIPQEIRFIFNNLDGQKDSNSPLSPHFLPTFSPTTINPNPNPKEKIKRFVSPPVEDIKNYMAEIGYPGNAENFVNYYASKGWLVGKSPMKDWKAAVRTWHEKYKKENPQVAIVPSVSAEQKERIEKARLKVQHAQT